MHWAGDEPAAAPASIADPFEVTASKALTDETWPNWRNVYVRLFFDDDVDPEQEKKFYERVRTFFGETVAASGGSLPKPFADDSVAWVALAWNYFYKASDIQPGDASREKGLTLAADASRKAISLADPHGIASYTLARS